MDELSGAGISALCQLLGIRESDLRRAKKQTRFVYVEKTIIDKKSRKPRHLCYPRKESLLYQIQGQLKDKLLSRIPLLDEVRGYRPGSHNVSTAALVCGRRSLGIVDIAQFHPSITARQVVDALVAHGLSYSWAREIARLVTYNDVVPQGASTSNHIANIVMDHFLREFVKPFADSLRVRFCNFGDDIAFFANDHRAVEKCVRVTKRELRKSGFRVNNQKTRVYTHSGGPRCFLGCSTARNEPDYPREKYRAFRKELRELLYREQNRICAEPITSFKDICSIKQRIAYVKRLNPKKASRLRDLYFRILAARRSEVCASYRKGPTEPPNVAGVPAR